MTHAEKVNMYKSLEKHELINMLIAANDAIYELQSNKKPGVMANVTSHVSNNTIDVYSNDNPVMECRHEYVQTASPKWKCCTYCGVIAPVTF
jgi:hypothetical protein